MRELTETEIDGDPRSRGDNPLARVAGHARINSESNRRKMPRRAGDVDKKGQEEQTSSLSCYCHFSFYNSRDANSRLRRARLLARQLDL